MRYDSEGIAAFVRRVKTEYPRVSATFVVGPADDAEMTDADRRQIAAVDVPIVVESDRLPGTAEMRWDTGTGRAPGEERTVYAP